MVSLIDWVLVVLVPFVIGVLLASGTVLEGIGLFCGLSAGLVLFTGILGEIRQHRENKKFKEGVHHG